LPGAPVVGPAPIVEASVSKAVKLPSTPALRALRAAGVDFEPLLYAYVERGGTAASSAALGVDEHLVIKTLIFEDEAKRPLVVLMHGDQEVSAKGLARQLGLRALQPCAPEVAERHSGYKVGGTSPFGLKKPLPVYVERSVLALPLLYINGGARGLLVRVAPAALIALCGALPVDAAAG
jgi:Cys-tRNA(Pro) deacylase